MTDPIADMLTRIRNAASIRSANCRVPTNRLKLEIAKVLEREGYITGYRTYDSKPSDGIGPQKWLEVSLKYDPSFLAVSEMKACVTYGSADPSSSLGSEAVYPRQFRKATRKSSKKTGADSTTMT